MSDYQVGDAWLARNSDGSTAKVWLSRMEGSTEVWRWVYNLRDGSRSATDTDWAASKSGAIRNCKQCASGTVDGAFRKQPPAALDAGSSGDG